MADEVEVVDAPVEAGVEVAVDNAPEIDAELMSDLDILNQDDDKPADEAAADENATEDKPDDATKTEEQKAAEQKAAEEKKTADANLPPTVKALRDSLDKNPTLKAELAKPENAPLRNMLYANARRSQELNVYKEQFATPELAKFAREGAEDFSQIEGMYLGKSSDGYEKLLGRMAEVSNEGQIEGFFTHHRINHFWPAVSELAKRQGAEDIAEAVDLISEFLGDKKGAAPQRTQQETGSELPADVKARLARLDTLERQQGTQTSTQQREYEKGAIDATLNEVRTQLKTRVSSFAPALSELALNKVIDDTLREISEKAGKDTLYQNKWASMMRAAKSAGTTEAKDQLVKMAASYAKGISGPIIQKHVRVFGEAAVKASQQKTTTLTTQKAKTEIKSAGAPITPARQGDVHSMIREGRQLSQKLFRRDLTDLEILNIEDTVESFGRMAKQRGK